ncbi:hypothetical protein [Dokdonella sp.]|uniref:hypothetical protein n=1 Tax=Dokdonella sp. TaxID=2291710 RepID=UPI0031C61A14|nr:hypothetical protein [Dokdonella sp.]
MNISRTCVPLLVAACLSITAAQANDSRKDHQYELWGISGTAGQPAQTDDQYTHSNGGYQCTNAATRPVPHVVRYPFTIPDTNYLNWVTVHARHTSDAPPMELAVLKTCLAWHSTEPPVTTELVAWPVQLPPGEGYFSVPLGVHDTPDTYNCRYWVEARIDISAIPCTTGISYIQKIRLEHTLRDRIFRGMFNTNAPTTP